MIIHLFAMAIASDAFGRAGALDAEGRAKALRGRDQIPGLVEIYALKDPRQIEAARELLSRGGQPGLTGLVERGIESARARIHRGDFDEVKDPGVSGRPDPL